MKKLIAALLLMMLCACTALAEAPDYAAMTDEELSAAMAAISAEMGRRAKAEKTTDNGESLGKIKDVFPDEALALIVRDKCGKFSIEQTVTQEDLDRVTTIIISNTDYGCVQDLTGIGKLRKLKRLSFYNSMKYEGTTLPEEFFTLSELDTLELAGSPNLCELPEGIGNLTNLTYLDLSRTGIPELPETIGQLTKLKYLKIAHTKITALPDAIWNLELSSLDMAGLPIK